MCSSAILLMSSSEPSDEIRDADLIAGGLIAALKPFVMTRCSLSFFALSDSDWDRDEAADEDVADRASESSEEFAATKRTG